MNSILSASNSRRSSLVNAISISSRKLSTSSDIPWSAEEFNFWHELVDESLLEQDSIIESNHEADLLHLRPCCSFFEKDDERPLRCDMCGFSSFHYDARSLMVFDGGRKEWADADRFGNTSLHHAAAAGNIANVMELISGTVSATILPDHSESFLNHRNTSGETVLHVFRIKGPEYFPEYTFVLEASTKGFNFQTRDYNGKLVADRLPELMDDWNIDQAVLCQAAEILGMDPVSYAPGTLDETGPFRDNSKTNDPKKSTSGLHILKNILSYSRIKRSKASENSPDAPDANGDTVLISTLRNWPHQSRHQVQIGNLIEISDIHMRDRRGDTALAIAAGNGIREVVFLLLENGANPNSRSHQKTSVMAYAAANLI